LLFLITFKGTTGKNRKTCQDRPSTSSTRKSVHGRERKKRIVVKTRSELPNIIKNTIVCDSRPKQAAHTVPVQNIRVVNVRQIRT